MGLIHSELDRLHSHNDYISQSLHVSSPKFGAYCRKVPEPTAPVMVVMSGNHDDENGSLRPFPCLHAGCQKNFTTSSNRAVHMVCRPFEDESLTFHKDVSIG